MTHSTEADWQAAVAALAPEERESLRKALTTERHKPNTLREITASGNDDGSRDAVLYEKALVLDRVVIMNNEPSGPGVPPKVKALLDRLYPAHATHAIIELHPTTSLTIRVTCGCGDELQVSVIQAMNEPPKPTTRNLLEVMSYGFRAPDKQTMERDIALERRKHDADVWIIKAAGEVLTKDGIWTGDRLPSSLTDSYVARTRWTFQEALLALDRLRINGWAHARAPTTSETCPHGLQRGNGCAIRCTCGGRCDEHGKNNECFCGRGGVTEDCACAGFTEVSGG